MPTQSPPYRAGANAVGAVVQDTTSTAQQLARGIVDRLQPTGRQDRFRSSVTVAPFSLSRSTFVRRPARWG